MNNSINEMFKKLSETLKGNNSKEIDSLLSNFGVTKDEVVKKLEEINGKELLSKVNNESLDNVLQNLSPEQINKIKNIDINNKKEVEKLYKQIIDQKKNK